ncbi:BofC C-terminal domain-containing protein [Paenibacillus sp. YYML68]|uniref:BofC C-terminal domain-containing protein n=1 Tax=Paenibacillus sp. YYML68 TaxID=2909250 RepID=UPI00248F503C|nr:BofC C-terminal domain-containing protein [Paenibacillus sp. YYML68]
MTISAFWSQLKKHLKRRFRRKKRWLNLAVMLIIIGAGAAWLQGTGQEEGARPSVEWERWKDKAVFGGSLNDEETNPEEEVKAMISGLSGKREAYSRKAYLCGEEVERIGVLDASGILDYYLKHPRMSVSLSETSEAVYFVETINDLSPRCKESAYFGLDVQGNLSIFEGVPGSGNDHVMRTFFQLNIEHLESSLPRETVRQLYQGIRIHDLDDYNSVLSTLSDYAVEVTEKAMQPAAVE